MIRTLLKKEFDSMLPFVGLIVALTVSSLVMLLFEMPHLHSYPTQFDTYMTGGFEQSTMLFLMAIALTSGLLMREYDDGTIEFLDSLPLSRSLVFFCKTVAAFSVLALFLFTQFGIGLFLHAISRDSLEPDFHWSMVGILMLLQLCQLLTMFSIGLAASFMRRFGWLAIGIIIIMFIFIKEFLPAVEVMNFLAYLPPSFEGDQCVVPWRQVVASLILSFVLLVASYFMFLGSDQFVTAYNRISETRLGGAILILGSAGIAIVGITLFIMAEESGSLGEEPPDPDEVVVSYPSWNTSRTRTKFYNAVFPANLSTKANQLLKQSDPVFVQVQNILGSDENNEILLDATSLIPRHAGLATWDTIRMDLNASDDIDTLLSILAHETAHVMMETMSDRRLSDIANNTRFWHEGVASYIEFHHFPSESNIQDYYRTSAYMRHRDEIEYEEFTDDSILSSKYDTLLVYPVGMMFIEALVDKHSEDAIGNIVRAMNRANAPKGLTGMAFWRDTFQACGYSLDSVINAFFERLDEEVNAQADWLDSIPDLEGKFSENEYTIDINVVWEPQEGWEPICRFRQTKDAPDRQYRYSSFDEENGFFVSRSFFPSGIAWYQIGLRDPDGVRIYQPWTKVAIE